MEQQKQDDLKSAVLGALVEYGIEETPVVIKAIGGFIGGLFNKKNPEHAELAHFSAEELRGLFINLAKSIHGDAVKIEAKGPCCPPGTCGVCVEGVCIRC
jgi:hypothetical protein